MKKFIVIAIVVLLLGSGLVLLKKRRQAVSQAPTARAMIMAVATTSPKTRTISETRPYLATLKSVTSAVIAARTTARIIDLPVAENQSVEKNALLIRLDTRELEAQKQAIADRLKAARSRLDYTLKLLERDQALYEAGGLAREKLDLAKVQAAEARGAVAAIQSEQAAVLSQLSYSVIRAPFSGRIGTITRRPGDLATPGAPILTLNSPEQKLTFTFPPLDRGTLIRTGQTVLLQNREIGTIDTLYDDTVNGLAVAEVRPRQRIDLPSGSSVRIEVITGSASGCTVPRQAILHRQDRTSVMAYEDGRFQEQAVTIQLRDRSTVLIDPCPQGPVAVGAETRISLLPALGRVSIRGEKDE